MNLNDLVPAIQSVAAARHPIMLRGRHGVGKSDVVRQIATFLQLPVIERRISILVEGELYGLPFTDNTLKFTAYRPPDWLYRASQEPVILFFDEVDRGILEVAQGIMQLTDSRCLADCILHPDTLIFAGCNSGENIDEQYQTRLLDPAELSRWVVFDFDPTIDEWLIWAAGNCDWQVHAPIISIIIEFITHNQSHLEHIGETSSTKIYPSRRSWHRFSDCIANLNYENNSRLIYSLACGYVGKEAAIAFKVYLDTHMLTIKPKDILKGLIPYSVIHNLTLGAQSTIWKDMSSLLHADLDDVAILSLIKFFDAVPDELAIKMYQDLADLAMKNIKNVTLMSKFINADIALVNDPPNIRFGKAIYGQGESNERQQ